MFPPKSFQFANVDVAKIGNNVDSLRLTVVQGAVLLLRHDIFTALCLLLKQGDCCSRRFKKMNTVISYPTVVMEINENQKASPAPFGNDLEKPSDFQLESFVRKKRENKTLFTDESGY